MEVLVKLGINKEEVRAALKKKSGRVVGPYNIPAEVWRCRREGRNRKFLLF